MKKTFLLPIVFIFILSCTQEKTCKINIHFKGKEFEKLNLEIRQESKDIPRIIIHGESSNRKDWTFTYPDSIFDKHMYVGINVPSSTDSVETTIAFMTVIENDTLKTGSYSFSKGNSEIEATYINTEQFSNILYTNKDNKPASKTVYQNWFLVPTTGDKELLSSIESIGYRYSMFYMNDSTEYCNMLSNYIDVTKKYPESHFMINMLARNLTKYNSKQDVERVYNCFSENNKLSYFGLKVKNYLSFKFETFKFKNSVLPVCGSNNKELIVKDSSKYNLVVFSASWCTPCHEQIPLLKEIYRNFKNNLVITYVSLDEEKGIEAWANLMKKEEIPWRSLLAKDDLEKIKERYFVNGIPHTMLVYPNGREVEVLDVRKESNYKRLVELIGGNVIGVAKKN
jgi:thiol-disulfide isomerase/thioredoxin